MINEKDLRKKINKILEEPKYSKDLRKKINKILEEPRYSVEEIPFPKEACFLVIDGNQTELEYVVTAFRKRFGNKKGKVEPFIIVTNKEIFFSEPRYSVEELEKINGYDAFDADWDEEQQNHFFNFIKENPKKVQEILDDVTKTSK